MLLNQSVLKNMKLYGSVNQKLKLNGLLTNPSFLDVLKSVSPIFSVPLNSQKIYLYRWIV